MSNSDENCYSPKSFNFENNVKSENSQDMSEDSSIGSSPTFEKTSVDRNCLSSMCKCNIF